MKIKAVPASKPAGVRSVAADLAVLAAVDWPVTPGVTLVTMSGGGRTAIGSPSYGLYVALVHAPRRWKTPRPRCQLS